MQPSSLEIDQRLQEIFSDASKRLRVIFFSALERWESDRVQWALSRLLPIQNNLKSNFQRRLNYRMTYEYISWMANIERTPELMNILEQLNPDNVIAGREVIRATWGVVHVNALENLIREWSFTANNAINGITQNLQWRLSEFTRLDIQTSIATNLAAWSWLQKSKDSLVDIIRGKGVGAFRDSAGRVRTLPRYSEMIVRTETARAFNTATINRGLEIGITKYKVNERPDACVICQPHRWKVYWNAIFPPYHPNCRWFITPVLPE